VVTCLPSMYKDLALTPSTANKQILNIGLHANICKTGCQLCSFLLIFLYFVVAYVFGISRRLYVCSHALMTVNLQQTILCNELAS
jgi:hypothetical protein